MKCKCGSDLIPNQKFCGKCGSEVIIDETKVKKCPAPSCGVSLRKDLKFCTSCGYKFEEASSARGLAVICVHAAFVSKLNLKERQNAHDDANMMEKTWKNYGCETLIFYDETTEFYNKTLTVEVEQKLNEMSNLKLFVFVLSTHGQEVIEAGGGKAKQINHLFCTKDSQYETQSLIDSIAEIKILTNTLKLFIIQACRSQAYIARDQCIDEGVQIEVKLENLMIKEDGSNENVSSIKEICDTTSKLYDGVDASDAFPMGGNDNENNATSQSLPRDATFDVNKEQILEMPPIQAVPHCVDCIVLFASMSGKFAYSKMYSQEHTGGWLIKSVDTIFNKKQPEGKVHILDLLTEVNRDVGTKQLMVKQNLLDLEELERKSGIGNEELHKLLQEHIDNLKEVTDKNMKKTEIQKYKVEVNKFAQRLNDVIACSGAGNDNLPRIRDGDDSLPRIREELKSLTDNIVEKCDEKCDFVELKAQSCFFHNLAFDDDKLYIEKGQVPAP